jgi:hypothetical protein
MTQLTIELHDMTQHDLEQRVQAEGLNVQEWVERFVRRHVHPYWPDDVCGLAGVWPDLPSLEELRSSQGDSLTEK